MAKVAELQARLGALKAQRVDPPNDRRAEIEAIEPGSSLGPM